MVVGAIIEANRTPEEKAKIAAAQKAAQEKRKVEQAAASEAEKKRFDRNFDEFMKRIRDANAKAERTIIQRVVVKNDNATLTVENAWHLMPYQLRLQAAQNLWKAWASIASPTDPAKARISIVDINGNEVGGSGVLGIWVQEK